MGWSPIAALAAALAVSGAACAQTMTVETAVDAPAGRALPLHIGGRVLATDDGYESQWPGAYFETAFSGREVFFQTGAQDVRLRVTIDDRSVEMLRPGAGLHRIGGLSEGDHRLRVDIVSENQAAPIRFGGVFGTPALDMRAPSRSRQIEFIGDSHTVGYANTSTQRTCSPRQVWETTDTALGVAGRVAARFDADYQVNAISGRGVIRNYDGMAEDTLPQAYPFVLFDKQVWSADGAWRPQVIVIALGTNDFSTPLRPGERWASREELTADYEAAYAAFIRGQRLRAAEALIVGWGPQDSEMAQASARVFQTLKAEGDDALAFVAAPGLTMSACDWHPDVDDDQRIADALGDVIQARFVKEGR